MDTFAVRTLQMTIFILNKVKITYFTKHIEG